MSSQSNPSFVIYHRGATKAVARPAGSCHPMGRASAFMGTKCREKPIFAYNSPSNAYNDGA